MALFAPAFILIITVALALPVTRDIAYALVHHEPAVREGEPLEWATFLFALAAGIVGVRLAWSAPDWLERCFFLAFSTVMLFIAVEEVSWVQWIVHFETLAWMQRYNRQGEMSLHNLGPLQGRNAYLRLRSAWRVSLGSSPRLDGCMRFACRSAWRLPSS